MKAKWVDLSRFGATLKILPKSPLRTASATLLEIRDKSLFEQGLHEGEPWTSDEIARARPVLMSALEALGFGPEPKRLQFDESTGQTPLQFFSLRTKFSLEDLQSVLPRLQPSDMRDMPLHDIVAESRPAAEVAEQWKQFAERQLAVDAIDVWTPKVNPFGASYGESRPIRAIDPTRDPAQRQNDLIGGKALAPHRIVLLLDDAHYREDALVMYYADLSSAEADGWSRDSLQQQSFPFALPLWISDRHRITALKDVRHAPEIMDLSPDRAYSSGDFAAGIVGVLRDLPAARRVLTEEVTRWLAWADGTTSLTDPQNVVDSLQVMLQITSSMHLRYPRIPMRMGSVRMSGEEGVPSSVRPLREIEASQMWDVAVQLRQYGIQGAGNDIRGLASVLTRVLEQAHEGLREVARDVARTKLQTLATAVRKGLTTADEEGKTHHVDAGEHIGGARKDFARRALTVEDLDAMNDQERKALLVKKNIWPPLDYEAMRESGMDAAAAFSIKYLKDKLPVSPDRRLGRPNVEAEYIAAIEYVRDRLATVREMGDVLQAMADIYQFGITFGEHQSKGAITGGTPTQVQWGNDFSYLVWDGGGDGRPYLPRKLARELRNKVGEDRNNWSALIKPKRQKSEHLVAEEKQKAEIDRELHRPHLDHVQRIGTDWRQGREISADDLIAHFGFRGVQFGNWLPQDERQDVLNMAFDSFCDLAQMLDLPPMAMSLDGELAIAFGSRGRGGKHAALAHYESERVVINLTRMKGAGTLAHEWTHAWDYHMGAGSSAVDKATRDTPLGDLVMALHQRPTTPDALFDKAWENALRGKDNVNSWLYLQPADKRDLLKETNEVLFQQAHDRLQLSAERQWSTFSSTRNASPRGAVTLDTISDVHDDIMARLKAVCPNKPGFTKVKEKIGANLSFYLGQLSIACTIEIARKENATLPLSFLSESNAEPTEFFAHAKKLDAMRASPYWATRRELFARAGAAFVQDKLEARGCRNDYLVYGADEKCYAEHPVGNPNPSGGDREQLGDRFEVLLDQFRLQYVARNETAPACTV